MMGLWLGTEQRRTHCSTPRTAGVTVVDALRFNGRAEMCFSYRRNLHHGTSNLTNLPNPQSCSSHPKPSPRKPRRHHVGTFNLQLRAANLAKHRLPFIFWRVACGRIRGAWAGEVGGGWRGWRGTSLNQAHESRPGTLLRGDSAQRYRQVTTRSFSSLQFRTPPANPSF